MVFGYSADLGHFDIVLDCIYLREIHSSHGIDGLLGILDDDGKGVFLKALFSWTFGILLTGVIDKSVVLNSNVGFRCALPTISVQRETQAAVGSLADDNKPSNLRVDYFVVVDSGVEEVAHVLCRASGWFCPQHLENSTEFEEARRFAYYHKAYGSHQLKIIMSE